MQPATRKTRTPFFLATDLDNTLVGDEKSLLKLNELLKRKKVQLIYLTGRYWESARKVMSAYNLLPPAAVVTDVGVEIRFAPDFEPDPVWKSLMKQNWEPEKIKILLRNYRFLELKQLPHQERLAYRLIENRHNIEHRLSSTLKKHGLQARVIVSSGVDVDILPPLAGKGNALKYVQHKLGIPNQRILVCGDSGNDLDMLLLGLPGVVVSNAQPEVLEHCLPHTVYRASKPYAQGIMEALEKVNLY
ncbi:HAD-IIB family hydrolase [Calderihabitans maritimus]|uniref:Sucrose-phosphate phosphatase n=1 Tax=Calderihabitans maritimus TaxID=1246530 RepID=A0A1Z5HSV7_9FIRM|nr:HAD-IIB family hydrolase [Calderihabitans maritimus]GAW92350.1 sucrose-phosphate phosphatase [Calderihabitans maritimus]